MIITKTPYRISFVGGGTDVPSFYKKHNGEVISATINKYIYVIVKKQLGYVEHKYRVNWSYTEFSNSINKIKHPIVRTTLSHFKINFPIEITTFAEIPSNTGLGSSSAFTVGLISGLTKLLNLNYSKQKIANLAFNIEVNILKRKIGKQDHYASCFGGLNKIKFYKNENVKVNKLNIKKKNYQKIQNKIFLIYTRQKRDAHQILKKQSKLSIDKEKVLSSLKRDILEFENLITSKKLNLNEIGKLLDAQWQKKKKVNYYSTNKKIDRIYNLIKKSECYGAKLLGAGRGGFFLVLSNTSSRKKLEKKIKRSDIVNFKFEDKGVHYFST
jgi:D-glycero-alpha-D-manno-heptose-7-phosphate kinase